MADATLEETINAAWETRDSSMQAPRVPVREAVETALDLLDKGKARVAREDGRRMDRQSVAEEGRAAVVPSERHGPHSRRSRGLVLLGQGAAEVRRLDRGRISRRAASACCRAPSCAARPTSHRASCCCRRSSTSAPTSTAAPWSTPGPPSARCAQIGKNCHISGGAGIGGVLEPLQAGPVIIEDNCFIGARAEVAEGVHRRRGLGAVDGRLPRRLDHHHRPRHRREALRQGAALFRRRVGHACRASRCPTASRVRTSTAP